jgi:hypothetical protein
MWQTYAVAAQHKILTVDEMRANEGYGAMGKGDAPLSVLSE